MKKTTRKTGKKKVKQILEKKSRQNPPEKTKLPITIKTEKDIQKIIKRISEGERGLSVQFVGKDTKEIFLKRWSESKVDKIIADKRQAPIEMAEKYFINHPVNVIKLMCDILPPPFSKGALRKIGV